MAALTELSIILPVFNEERIIPVLVERLRGILEPLTPDWEIIFVQDGSTDGSLDAIRKEATAEPRVKAVDLSRNFGHQAAVAAGLDAARGRAVVIMDADLQDAPEAIARFVAKWREGYDVVYAIRQKRKENFLKRFCFWAFYRIQQRMLSLSIPVDAGNFSLLDRKVVDAIRTMPEYNRYFSGLRAYAGFRQTGVPVERGPRYDNQPRVSFLKLVRLAGDGILAFSHVPLRLISILGMVLAGSSFAFGAFTLWFRLVADRPLLGWAFGLTTLSFIVGCILTCLGIIGEYVGRIYDEVKRRPVYMVRERINFD